MNSPTMNCFDEMHSSPTGVRSLYANYAKWLHNVPAEQLESKRKEAELLFRRVELRLNLTHFVLITFITAMLSLTIGLLCFLREIILASKEIIISGRQKPLA